MILNQMKLIMFPYKVMHKSLGTKPKQTLAHGKTVKCVDDIQVTKLVKIPTSNGGTEK